MKISILGAMALLLLGSSCNKAIDAVLDRAVSPSASASKADFTRYTIQKGSHHAEGNSYKLVSVQEQKFLVRFDSSAIYKTQSAENQYDINKLYGFADNKAGHHQFSARFGWRWSDGALRLFAYIYNNGQRDSKELKAIAIGKETACSIKVVEGAYVFTVDGEATVMPRQSTTPLGEGYQLYPYFGGDEKAPHTISIWIKPMG